MITLPRLPTWGEGVGQGTHCTDHEPFSHYMLINISESLYSMPFPTEARLKFSWETQWTQAQGPAHYAKSGLPPAANENARGVAETAGIY